MRTKIYNGITGVLNIICGIYLGLIVGYYELRIWGLVLTMMEKSDAKVCIKAILLLLCAIAVYVEMALRGAIKIKAIYKPNEENKVVLFCIDVISLFFLVKAFKLFNDNSEIFKIIYIVSIIILICEIIILFINIMKEKLQIFNECNCLNIVNRVVRTTIPVIIIGMAIIFKNFIVANVEQMQAFQSLNGGFDSFTMTDFDGNEYTEDMFKGHKVTMINIWATTCHGCIMEMPDLQEISEMYDDKDFQLVGIVGDLRDYNTGEVDKDQVELAKEVMNSTGVKYTTLIPSMEIQMGVLQGVTGYPTTIFFDENGNQLKVVEASRPKETWIEIIEEVLASEK